jgi:hypothetical protein
LLVKKSQLEQVQEENAAKRETFMVKIADLEDHCRQDDLQRIHSTICFIFYGSNVEYVGKQLRNIIAQLRGSIRVFARLLPVSGTYPCAMVRPDGMSIRLVKPYLGEPEEKKEEHSFNFDKAFGPSATQDEVFAEVSEFVQSALDGYSSCVFSYGESQCGKTFTLRGSTKAYESGVVPRAVSLMQEYVGQQEDKGWEYRIEVKRGMCSMLK